MSGPLTAAMARFASSTAFASTRPLDVADWQTEDQIARLWSDLADEL
jgi:hypothetical protein